MAGFTRRQYPTGRLLGLLVVGLVASEAASAGKLLDYLRNYDLNDYALGAALSVSEQPYIGTDQSTIFYPYLTSFQHSAFTDDWFLIEGSDIGLRYVPQSDWEFAALARLRTLGFGGTESNELRGLDARRATIELGPMVGWRGWPVNIQLRSFWDVLGRHNGGSTELEFSWPQEFSRGYIIPSVRFTYLSNSFTRYYYGVADYEATPGRPAYEPDTATNTWAGVVLGYELSPKWLLTTTVGVEYLDSTIVSSPIVDQDTLWSVNVGLAYNSDIFNPPDGHDEETARFELRLGSLWSTTDSAVIRESSLGEPGEEIDLEEILGESDNDTLVLVDSFFRLSYFHRLDLSYFELQRSSMRTLEQDIEFGDLDLPAGTELGISAQSSAMRFSYSYSLMRDAQKELGVSGGISRTRFDTEISAETDNLIERMRVDAVVPTIGVFGSLALGDHWLLSADINAFALEFDRFEGYVGYVNANLDRRFGDNIRAGLGFSFIATRLESTDADIRGLFRFRHYGPKLNLAMSF